MKLRVLIAVLLVAILAQIVAPASAGAARGVADFGHLVMHGAATEHHHHDDAALHLEGSEAGTTHWHADPGVPSFLVSQAGLQLSAAPAEAPPTGTFLASPTSRPERIERPPCVA